MSYGGSGNYARTPLSNSRHASPEAELEIGFDDKSMLGATSVQTRLSGQRGSESGHSNLNMSDQAGFFQSLSALPPQAAQSGTSSDTMSHFPGLASIPGAHYPTDQRSRFPSYLQQQTMIPRSGTYQHHLQSGVISPAYLHRMASGTSIQTPSGSEASGSFPAPALRPGPAHSASNSLLLASVGQDPGHDDEEEDDDEEDQDDDASSADDLHSSFEDEKPSASKTTVPQKRKGGRNTGSASSAKQKLDSKSTATSKKRKQADKDAEGKQQGKTDALADDGDSKSKSTRGSRACTVCRRLKMRCELSNIEDDTKCRRCRAGGHECVFEESQRGRRKNQKTDAMAKSIRAMENTLETVLKAIAAGNAHTVAGMTLGPDGNLVPAAQGPESIVGPSFSFPPMPSSDLGTGQPSNGPMGADTFSMADHRPETHHPSGPSPTSLQNHHSSGLPPLPPPRPDDLLSQVSGQATSPGMRLHSLPEPENTWAPLGLLAEASLENNQLKRRRNTFLASNLPHTPSANEEIEHNKAKATRDPASRDNQADERPQKLGPANDAYYQPGPFNILPLRQMMIDTQLPSPLLTDKIITVEEAVLLFNLYYRECAMHTAHYLLEDWHTPMNVSSRSTFLFTTICAVASKFYTARPELYGLCMPYARKLASDMIERGFKSVEIVQAYMLLAYYNTPTERFEDDRTWTNIGLAIRMAVELNLWRNPKAPVGLDEEGIENFTMETMNRERTWYQIFIMDRSIAIQTGRPHSLHVTAFERNAKAWGHQRASREADAGAAAIVELYRITSGFQELLQLSCFATPGSASLSDYAVVTKAIDTALENWNSDWTEFSQKRENGASPTRQQVYSMTMKNFYFHYHRLLAYSYILQQIVRLSSNSLEILPYFLPCYESASQVLRAASEKLHPLGHLRYAQDLVFTNLSYAAVFLLKLLRPELAEFTDADRILAQVEQLVATLDGCSVDEHHIPALYAGFLKVLLAAKRSKDGNKPDDITLDPALADKLAQSQPANVGLSATLAALPAPRSAESPRQADAMPQIFAQDLGGGAVRPFGQAHSNNSAFMSGEPSNQASGGFWNLDQLGQAGFWENLSMPGLGSPPTYGLSAGHLFHSDPWPFSTPNSASASRNVSPKLAATPNVTLPSFGSL